MVMDRGVFRTWVPSRITSTWLSSPLDQVNGLAAIREWGFPVNSGLRGVEGIEPISLNYLLYPLTFLT